MKHSPYHFRRVVPASPRNAFPFGEGSGFISDPSLPSFAVLRAEQLVRPGRSNAESSTFSASLRTKNFLSRSSWTIIRTTFTIRLRVRRIVQQYHGASMWTESPANGETRNVAARIMASIDNWTLQVPSPRNTASLGASGNGSRRLEHDVGNAATCSAFLFWETGRVRWG